MATRSTCDGINAMTRGLEGRLKLRVLLPAAWPGLPVRSDCTCTCTGTVPTVEELELEQEPAAGAAATAAAAPSTASVL